MNGIYADLMLELLETEPSPGVAPYPLFEPPPFVPRFEEEVKVERKPFGVGLQSGRREPPGKFGVFGYRFADEPDDTFHPLMAWEDGFVVTRGSQQFRGDNCSTTVPGP